MLSFDEAWHIVGGLSSPSKMPCFAYGLPPEACKTGSVLRAKVPDSICARCYSFEGRARFSGVKTARSRRLESLTHPRWTEAMIKVIGQATPITNPYFRWHDSGDIQSDEHFSNICEVARTLPQINFWLPTQESRYARDWEYPPNLVVRVSAPLLGGHAPYAVENVSSVVSKTLQRFWPEFVARNTKVFWRCPAKLEEKYQCGECRACWDPETYHIQYLET